MKHDTDAPTMTAGQRLAATDIFEKCRRFTRPRDLMDAGLYLYFETFGERDGCGPGEVSIDGRRVLMFGSNDYLALTVHPKVMEAAQDAVRRYGAGCSGSRLLNGTLDLHLALEQSLAKLVGKPAALVFSTGFLANFAALSALGEKGDVFVCDHNLHASLVEGALASRARTLRFRHNDMEHMERCLLHCSPDERLMVVSEGVFSMEGDLADLAGTVRLAKAHGARLYVDEAHGIGVLGPNGAGAAEAAGVLDQVDIVMGTFSKSLASLGGFIAASEDVIGYLKHTARPFVFSASLAPASVAAAHAALQILQAEPERRRRLLAIADLLRDELRQAGYQVPGGGTPIVPVVIQNELDVCRLSKALLAEGIYVNPVLKPAASLNLLRISCTAAHTEAHVERLVETLKRLSDSLGIPRK